MTEYQKLLQDPRWQKKRLDIFQRDNFACRLCRSKDKTLHCHHQYYERGLLPWEYPDITLITLCCDCHEEEEERKDDDKEATMMLLRIGFTRRDVDTLRDSILGFLMRSKINGIGNIESFNNLNDTINGRY